MSTTRIDPVKSRGGIWVTLGDEEYRVPPLAFRALQELADEVSSLRTITTKPTVEQMATVNKVVHAAFVRNYPAMTIDEIGEMLDISNFADVLGAVLNIAGFKQAKDGASGEAKASTGTVSIAP